MRNLTMGEWATVMVVLGAILGLGLAFDSQALLATASVGFILVSVERAINLLRERKAFLRNRAQLHQGLRTLQACDQNPSGERGHGCILNADDGHTMHRCAFGDCEWGHR